MINIMTMPQTRFRFVPVVTATALVVMTAFFVMKLLSTVNDRSNVLRSLGYKVETKNATFRGFSSQIISTSKNNEYVILQVVRNVQKDASGEILKELNNTIDTIQQKVVITDPYSGRQQDLSLPESLKPVKENILIKRDAIPYYLVYANEIFSLKIFSEAEATHKGIFSTYYCPKEKAVYSLEIYSDVKHFNKEKEISLMSSLFCK